MDEYFEQVKADFLEVEPLDFEQTAVFYQKYKIYLEEANFNDEDDFKKYKEIISEIAKTYAIAKKYDVSTPLLRKAIRLKEDVKGNYFWLGMTYFNLDKPVLAYYYLSKGKPSGSETGDFAIFMKIVKGKVHKKLFDVWIYLYVIMFAPLVAYKWIFGEIEIYWVSVLYNILLAYSIIHSIVYAYQYFKFKAQKK